MKELSDRLKTLRERIEYLKAHPDEVNNSEGMTKPYAESHNLVWLESELDQHREVADWLMKHGPVQ